MYLNFNITYTDRIFISFVFLFNFNIWYLINILKYNTSLFIDIDTDSVNENKQGENGDTNREGLLSTGE